MITALVMLCHMTGPCDQASAVSSFRTLTPITTCGMQAQTAAAELLFDFGLRTGDVRMVVRCEIGQRL